MQKRQSTFALKTRSFVRIILSLDRFSNNYSLKFIFDNNRETCDVLLYNESFKDNINRRHFYITININTKIFIVNDESTYNIIITFR